MNATKLLLILIVYCSETPEHDTGEGKTLADYDTNILTTGNVQRENNHCR